jgi:hypothetical protein
MVKYALAFERISLGIIGGGVDGIDEVNNGIDLLGRIGNHTCRDADEGTAISRADRREALVVEEEPGSENTAITAFGCYDVVLVEEWGKVASQANQRTQRTLTKSAAGDQSNSHMALPGTIAL